MTEFHAISPEEIGNAFDSIGKDWMLITVKDEENKRVNAMTASWGAMGVLWNRKVCICFVRPQRHTCKLLREQSLFSIGFLGEEHREAHKILGRKSGADLDKLSACGLESEEIDGVPVIREAERVLICKRLYEDDIRENSFLAPELLANYTAGDYHRFYICEIVGAYRKGE